MNELNQRDTLYNAILGAVKEHGPGMEIGLVRAVLNEVDGAIASMASRCEFDSVYTRLTERMPRECSQHSRSGGQ